MRAGSTITDIRAQQCVLVLPLLLNFYGQFFFRSAFAIQQTNAADPWASLTLAHRSADLHVKLLKTGIAKRPKKEEGKRIKTKNEPGRFSFQSLTKCIKSSLRDLTRSTSSQLRQKRQRIKPGSRKRLQKSSVQMHASKK